MVYFLNSKYFFNMFLTVHYLGDERQSDVIVGSRSFGAGGSMGSSHGLGGALKKQQLGHGYLSIKPII